MEITLSNCRTGCRTQDHESYGECLRESNISIGNEQVSSTLKKNEKELTAYRDARKVGIQPASTRMKDIQKAVRVSEVTGRAAKA
jgi:hypothetical protein